MDKKERLNLAKDILIAIAVLGGVMVIAVVTPNAFSILSPFIKKYKKSALKPNYIKRKFTSLQKQKMIYISEQNGKTKITLTKKGRLKVLEYQVDEMEIKKQKIWDKKWRVVIFDIPEKKKLARNVFRQKLMNLGFEKIQQSVWKHKYPCNKEIKFLAHLYEITPYVELIEGKIGIV